MKNISNLQCDTASSNEIKFASRKRKASAVMDRLTHMWSCLCKPSSGLSARTFLASGLRSISPIPSQLFPCRRKHAFYEFKFPSVCNIFKRKQSTVGTRKESGGNDTNASLWLTQNSQDNIYNNNMKSRY